MLVGSDAVPAALPRKQGLGRRRGSAWDHYRVPARSLLTVVGWPARRAKARKARQQLSRKRGPAVVRKTPRWSAGRRAPPPEVPACQRRILDVAPTGAPSPFGLSRREERKTGVPAP